MREKKIIKIPIVTYLCYLLAVSILFTGVTFSRYTSSTSGDVGAGISPFVAFYEIGDISATSYTNADFYLQSGAATGTPRTIRMTVRNFEADEQGNVLRYSDVDLQATFRLYLPAELADNLVLQVAEAADDVMTVLTPQYVIGDLVYEVSQGSEDTDGDGVAEYVREQGTYADYTGGGVRETAKSNDYQSGECKAETLTMSGRFSADGTGYIAAHADNGNAISVTSEKKVSQYSVGFHRGVDRNDYRSQLYLDLEQEMRFYSIDVTLPRMALAGTSPQERSFVIYITLAQRIDGSDYNVEWTEAMDELLMPPASGQTRNFNGAKVLGYHFDVQAQTYASLPAGDAAGTTTVRVQKTYDYAGGASVSYHHVAPISESTYSYVHPIADFFAADGTSVAQPDTTAKMQSVFGVCNNLLGQAGAYYISFNGLPDEPMYEDYAAQTEGGAVQYQLFTSLSKSYSSQFNVLFVQTSESIRGGDGT